MSEGRTVRPKNTFDLIETAAKEGKDITLDEADVLLLAGAVDMEELSAMYEHWRVLCEGQGHRVQQEDKVVFEVHSAGGKVESITPIEKQPKEGA